MPVIKTKMTKYDKLLVEGKVAMREIFEAAAQGDAFYSRAANRIKHAQSHRSTGMSLDDFAVAWAKHGCATTGAALEQSRFMSEAEFSSLHNQTLMPPQYRTIEIDEKDIAPDSSTESMSIYEVYQDLYGWDRSKTATRV